MAMGSSTRLKIPVNQICVLRESSGSTIIWQCRGYKRGHVVFHVHTYHGRDGVGSTEADAMGLGFGCVVRREGCWGPMFFCALLQEVVVGTIYVACFSCVVSDDEPVFIYINACVAGPFICTYAPNLL